MRPEIQSAHIRFSFLRNRSRRKEGGSRGCEEYVCVPSPQTWASAWFPGPTMIYPGGRGYIGRRAPVHNFCKPGSISTNNRDFSQRFFWWANHDHYAEGDVGTSRWRHVFSMHATCTRGESQRILHGEVPVQVGNETPAEVQVGGGWQ